MVLWENASNIFPNRKNRNKHILSNQNQSSLFSLWSLNVRQSMYAGTIQFRKIFVFLFLVWHKNRNGTEHNGWGKNTARSYSLKEDVQ